MNIDLGPAHMETVSRILASVVPDCEVLAFGSRVKGNARKYSDLDLAVRGTAPLGMSRYARLSTAFEESNLPINVDILDWHTIPESFRRNIRENCQIVQESPEQSGNITPAA